MSNFVIIGQSVVKISKFEKSQYLRNGRSDFDKISYHDASVPRRYRQQIKVYNFENPRWQLCHLEKSKNLNNFATD